MKAENPAEAIGEFLGVPALEPEKGDWYAALHWHFARICYGEFLIVLQQGL